MLLSQDAIATETGQGPQAARRLADAEQAVAAEVPGIVQTLRQMAGAASEITRIALQTRLVAFSASVEARRAARKWLRRSPWPDATGAA